VCILDHHTKTGAKLARRTQRGNLEETFLGKSWPIHTLMILAVRCCDVERAWSFVFQILRCWPSDPNRCSIHVVRAVRFVDRLWRVLWVYRFHWCVGLLRPGPGCRGLMVRGVPVQCGMGRVVRWFRSWFCFPRRGNFVFSFSLFPSVLWRGMGWAVRGDWIFVAGYRVGGSPAMEAPQPLPLPCSASPIASSL
jgi:hypothetical protein